MRAVAALALACVALSPRDARAQLDPADHWKTIETKHFHVHFGSGLEQVGKRAAVSAERAFAELSTELRAPKGKIDLVVADNIDFVNGYASAFPSNRIVVFAHPPIDAPELRNYDDWLRLVVTHELTHIFHGDRADGLWRAGRYVFGRHPALFPNFFLPSWIVEGLAVYYESRVTGAGRLEGSEHYMVARAAAEAHRLPRIDQLSRATTRFPDGEVVYAYGGLILDYLSRTRGPDKIAKFVDVTSRVIFPLSLNAKAKRAFGISFENAWRDWRDSLEQEARTSAPLPGWKQLTREGRYVRFPRWLGDTAIVYAASNGKEVASAYSVSTGGRVTRIGRRNGLDMNAPAAGGSLVFSQPDYIDPFHIRNDLYVDSENGIRRLTHGARISEPDVRADGSVVAVQAVPGSTVLVRSSIDRKTFAPITASSLDTQWGEPRWSPDGRWIAATRVTRANSEIVVLDSNGKEIRVAASHQGIVATPSWSPDGKRILYTSTMTGSPQVYWAEAGGTGGPHLVTSAGAGVLSPELSPGGDSIAALEFRYDGYHVGVSPFSFDATTGSPASSRSPRESCGNCRLARTIEPPLAEADVPRAHGFSPWRSLLPTYWEPVVGGSPGEGTSIGAATSGEDVIGRHRFFAQATGNTTFREAEGFLSYRYAGLGQPFLDLSVEQNFEHSDVTSRSTGHRVADLSRRIRTLGLNASLTRPRMRTFASLVLGADVESRAYTTDPDTILLQLPQLFRETRRYPSLVATASWTNVQRPQLSISREDGVSVSVSGRERWESGDFPGASRSVVGVTALYKSLALPGFAHHVLAVRAAGGFADERSISTFSVGGLSGGSLDAIAGVSVGGERRTFGVRGFPPSAQQGIRALAATLEYRAPLAAPSARVPFIPVLFDRISVAAFGDAGRAFCPSSASEAAACIFSDAHSPWLASAGAEVNFDTAVQYDIPMRFRAGFAVPVANRIAGGAKPASAYFTIGSSF